MFRKKVKFVRDMTQEITFLEKKISREVSKFNDQIENEVKKRFRRIGPNVQVRIEKILACHFMDSKNRKNPLIVNIESLNGRNVHQDGFWVQRDSQGSWFETENDLTVDQFRDILSSLSEELDVDFRIFYVDDRILSFD